MKIQTFGLILVIAGLLVIAGYIAFLFFIESEIPLFIKAGSFIIVTGIIVLLLSLIRERLREKEV